MYLETINSPADLKGLDEHQLAILAEEIRTFIVDAVSRTGGHLGSNLGAVELTLALHRTFDSPRDIILWDTGHQAYVHKLVTGRRDAFTTLRQAGGLSGYPSRQESPHDWIENSHASTVLSYAYGLATAEQAAGGERRRVVAVIGDGSMTGGMAYEGLNNLGHAGLDVVIILNDNGRSYAPTVSRLSESLARIRNNPKYVRRQARIEQLVADIPLVGQPLERAVDAAKAAVREMWEPPAFFENLGVRYTGPFDGHDIAALEEALRNTSDLPGPHVVHVLTQKGRGYPPAENDAIKAMHDIKAMPDITAMPDIREMDELSELKKPGSYTEAFSDALIKEAEARPEVVAMTAAMPDSTGLLPFAERFPDRCFDVGIAEQHAVTSAAGMAMGGLRPVIALYSTFLTRAIDQVVYDVGLHAQPVVFAIDRAGITGDDGASHHGVLDLVLLSKVPGMTIFCPSSYQEIGQMLHDALDITGGPCAIRWSKTAAPSVDDAQVGHGLAARQVRAAADPARSVCFIGVGKLLAAATDAAEMLAADDIDATVWDPRCVKPLDEAMLADAAAHGAVVTLEDGFVAGGIGSSIAARLRDENPTTPVRTLGIPDRFLPHGKPDQILADLGLDGAGAAQAARHLLGRT